MSDLETILQTTLDWGRMRKRFALATVVGARGSTYRQLGARQLMAGDGYSVGDCFRRMSGPRSAAGGGGGAVL